MLLCTVRNCRRALRREHKRLVCENGHSFDVARSGYINLLQPQDRRSRQPGDSAAAVTARRRLHDRGVTLPLLRSVAEMAQVNRQDIVLDAGCGDGYYLGSMARESGCEAHGIDISIPAVDAAARRYPECEWVIANADRFVPYADGSFSLVVSITGRMNPGEFRRVLRPDGRILIAVPAPGDLIELRGAGRDRVARTVADFSPTFQLIEEGRVTTTASLDTPAVEDVLFAIYRPIRKIPTVPMRLTLELDLMLFRISER